MHWEKCLRNFPLNFLHFLPNELKWGYYERIVYEFRIKLSRMVNMENEFSPELHAESEENVLCGSGKALNNIHEGF